MIIVSYHNVLTHRSAFNTLARRDWISTKQFERQLDWLAERYHFVSLEEGVRAIGGGTEISNACALTFDDGYAGTYLNALPVFERRGIPAALFVITGHAEGGSYDLFDKVEAVVELTSVQSVQDLEVSVGEATLDCDACKLKFLRRVRRSMKLMAPRRRDALYRDLAGCLGVDDVMVTQHLADDAHRSMTWQEIEDAAKRGFTIGSHTRGHATLSLIDTEKLDSEVRGSLGDLEGRLGAWPVPFAYPFGKDEHISEAAVAAVREAGYSCGVTTIAGVNTPATDSYRLLRVTFRDLARAEMREDTDE
jgi:peptidoglycan/xylan/chitin deacetylase (PgdA/CDA1 family)